MKIGILCPSIFMSFKKYPNKIFSPRDLVLRLANGLVDQGHQVWVFGTDDLETKAMVVGGDKELAKQELVMWKLRNKSKEAQQFRTQQKIYDNHKIELIVKAIEMGNQEHFDIMHYYYETDEMHFLQRFANYPVVYTLHDPMPTPGSIEYWLRDTYKNHYYLTISNRQRELLIPGMNVVETIYHGLDLNDFEFLENPKADYIAFIGRYTQEKNPQMAIEVALAVGCPIKIGAGEYEAKNHQAYYEEHIKPHVDNQKVTLTPFLKGKEKRDFLSQAKVFIAPLQWEEPFGLVFIEAMASGTPVIAFNHGAVPEIVVDGVTGYVVDPKEGKQGLINAYNKLNSLSATELNTMRVNARKRVETYFSTPVMVKNHLKAYQEIMQSFSA